MFCIKCDICQRVLDRGERYYHVQEASMISGPQPERDICTLDFPKFMTGIDSTDVNVLNIRQQVTLT